MSKKNIEIDKSQARILLKLLGNYETDLQKHAMALIAQTNKDSFKSALSQVPELKTKIHKIFPDCEIFFDS